MTALATCGNIRERINQPGMGSGLIGGGIVTGVAQVAEIAEGMRSVPGCTVVIDRVLGLGLVAILARRGLGTALGADRLGRDQEEYPHCDQ